LAQDQYLTLGGGRVMAMGRLPLLGRAYLEV
jgi:hypothetical protein